MAGLVAPKNLVINFAPSPRQYELWKLLQPNQCPHCGGNIIQVQTGLDRNGSPVYKPKCSNCGSFDLPQMILGGGAAGGGKAMLLNSEISTPFGFRKVRDIKVGDIISSATTGTYQKVIQVHPIETHDYYRVHFIDGTYCDCSEGHLWQCHESRKRLKKHDVNGNMMRERVWETRQMYEWYQKQKQGMYKGCHLIIPLCQPIQFTHPRYNKSTRPISPYILGALIGDGCLSSALFDNNIVEMTTMDDEIVTNFVKCGYDMTHIQQKPNNRAKSYKIYSATLVSQLRQLGMEGLAIDKFIPESYKYSTIEERKLLMQGLIDTDGYVDERGHLSYSTISKQLSEDIAWVVRSLGGIATIKQNKAGYKDKEGHFKQCNDVYDVYIRTKFDPELAHIQRKQQRCRYEFNGGYSILGKRIIDIELIGPREGRCITVDEPCGLYVVDNFTVTHNSYLGSCWIISNCMRFPDLRAVVARKTIKSLKGSTFKTMKNVLRDWGLKEYVNYKINNLEGRLTFWNDSEITLAELEDLPSDPDFQRLGSNEWTIGMVDEASEVSERAIEVLFSRLRYNMTNTFVIPRLLMTTNPCITWIRDRFVQDKDGNPVIPQEGEAYVPFSVFDNPNKAFVATYRAALDKITDRATRERLLYGNWDFVDTNDAAAYWQFDGEKHLVTGLRESVYDPLKPIILSFDFNVMPYMSCLAMQIDYEKQCVYIIEEILGTPTQKKNNTPAFADLIKNKYLNEQHTGGIVITGDPAGLARSSQTDDGVNNFTILMNTLAGPILRPKQKLMRKQPSHIVRLEFVNSLLNNYEGWTVQIDMRCRRFTEDLIYQRKNADGTKNKPKVTDPKLKVKYEKHGHLSDCFDLAMCLFLNEPWGHFQARTTRIETVHNQTVYQAFDY